MNRRSILSAGISVMTAIASVAALIPIFASFRPSARGEALGAPIVVDLSVLRPGQLSAHLYRGRPVLVLRRTPKMLEGVMAVDERGLDASSTDDPSYIKRSYRSLDPEYLVVDGVCTHLGCVPQIVKNENTQLPGDSGAGGFVCRCHGSMYYYAGRVVKGPAPRNLSIPPHRYLSPTTLVIGETPPLT